MIPPSISQGNGISHKRLFADISVSYELYSITVIDFSLTFEQTFAMFFSPISFCSLFIRIIEKEASAKMSLKQIAEMTGVSISTVSRVLNDKSSSCASKELRDRIWENARKTGYIPNEAARSLRAPHSDRPRSYSVTIVLARINSMEEEPFFYELFRNLEEELLQHKMTISEVIYAEKSFRQRIGKSDGIMIMGKCSDELFSVIKQNNQNIVGIWRNSMHFNVDEVICDGQKAAEMAMDYLISIGHRKIAYIGDCSNESRYTGYNNSLIYHDLPLVYGRVKQTNQTKSEAKIAFSQLISDKKNGLTDFSAVLCANDISAIGVLEVLAQEKKSLRDSISVISIDNIEEAQNTKPFLTTVNIPRKEMAHMAVNLLLDRISNNHTEHIRIEFPCRIVRRGSCHEMY